jgi:predicted TIM-barrel fold metal-dependent hydrolase
VTTQGTSQRTTEEAPDLTAPVPVVSADSHCGPRFEDMRPYCPKARLAEFDEQAERFTEFDLAGVIHQDGSPDSALLAEQIRSVSMTAGHHDFQARGRDMDAMGVTADVIFHGSQNGMPIPWVGGGFSFSHTDDLERRAVGLHIYNQWLADACTIQPERHIGAAHIPAWDVDASVRELEWARSAGLRAVNFPAPRPGVATFDDPIWEPLWSACEDLEMPLLTHGGNVDQSIYPSTGAHHRSMRELEAGGWMARRGMHWMIFSGVFERHPRLALVPTEQNGDWWTHTLAEYDSSYETHRWQLEPSLPEPPSFYCRRNVFIGASFMAPFEAEAAVREGYVENVVWGSDYPHAEGVWQYQAPGDETNTARLSMRYCFSSIPPAAIRAMLSDNGVKLYGLDAEALQKVADRIGAPTLQELETPIDTIPASKHLWSLAFRRIGPWG